MALRIGKLLGNGPEVRLSMQRKHDLHVTDRELANEIAKIPTLSAA